MPDSSRDYLPGLIKVNRRQISQDAVSDRAIIAEKANSVNRFDEVGGIDFNPNNLDLEVQGDELDINIPAQLQYLQTTPIEGFAPIIIQIKPTNLPLLLGVAQDAGEPVAANSTYQELSFIKED